MPSHNQDNLMRLSSRESSQPAPSRIQNIRTGVSQLFTGRSRVGGPRSQTPQSPKTPRLALGLDNFSSTRLVIPYLTRSNTVSSLPYHSPVRPDHNGQPPATSRPSTSTSRRQRTQRPLNSTTLPRVRRPARRLVGVDPAEQRLAELAQSRRTQRRAKARKSERRCAPKIKNRTIRAKILSCFISGLFLTFVLTIYLGLALSNRNESQEFHVLLILVILITTIFFCHSLVRLCMMIMNPPADDDHQNQNLPGMVGPGGFANPTVPIQVSLARDEEAAGIESEATKFPPPAYGLWRESVRMDPNQIFWQRNEVATARQNPSRHGEERPPTANRPPSYISDDGVDYVVEAAPRSTAPTTDVPLLPHPSERGRIGPMSSS
ncbi:Uncharacterized protein BP5553_03307 [Venustampulla echinocandica]|uniref:Uncharacterized protein n=1 Tax=Venustampulla echinocandica TaxID=2656787 RepID=A0A370TTV9_9HELO|nr:Uncharacterized protein BP5553_03307 [Venustampulla echinocandica]RDL38967.1 Uncharacterized protein BP5553_03307 [Venustampulla echinocandica]